MDYKILKEMCAVQAPSGDESAMTQYILDYVAKNKKTGNINQKFTAEKIFRTV